MQIPIAALSIGLILLVALAGMIFALRLPRLPRYQTDESRPPLQPRVWLVVLLIPILSAALM